MIERKATTLEGGPYCATISIYERNSSPVFPKVSYKAFPRVTAKWEEWITEVFKDC